MLRGEIIERGDDVVGAVANRAIAADQIGIEIEELDAASRETVCLAEIKEDRAATKERLDIAVEGRGVMKTKSRQQLALAAGPFEKWTNHGPFIDRGLSKLHNSELPNSQFPTPNWELVS